jgi:hypothetical protein
MLCLYMEEKGQGQGQSPMTPNTSQKVTLLQHYCMSFGENKHIQTITVAIWNNTR